MLHLAEFLENLVVGEGISSKLLSIFPVFNSQSFDDFLTLDEALKYKKFKVREVSTFGEVPQILVENGLNSRVLLLEGEEVKGAKQNRMINVTVLLKKKSRHTVPVSCVEAGRWSYRSEEFVSSGYVVPPQLRFRKIESFLEEVPEKGLFYANQKAIWREINKKLLLLDVPSPTQALSEAFEKLNEKLGEAGKNFSLKENQVGMLVGIGGKIVAFDFLGSRRNFPKVYPKFLRGYLPEAIELSKKPRVSKKKAENFMRRLVDVEDFTFKKSVSLGYNFFFKSENAVGQGLVFEGKILHLSAFSP